MGTVLKALGLLVLLILLVTRIIGRVIPAHGYSLLALSAKGEAAQTA